MKIMHTPGPWKIEPHDNCDKRYFVGPVMIDNDDVDHEEAEANGRLVSAAPDLLEILSLIVSEFKSDPMSVQCFDLRLVERAKRIVAEHGAK